MTAAKDLFVISLAVPRGVPYTTYLGITLVIDLQCASNRHAESRNTMRYMKSVAVYKSRMVISGVQSIRKGLFSLIALADETPMKFKAAFTSC